MAFNPDEYLAKKSAPKQVEFDPDAYLQKSGIKTEAPVKEKLPSPSFNILGPVSGLLEKAPVIGDYYKMPRVAAESALSSMTMGLSDPVIAGVESVGSYSDKITKALANKLMGQESQFPSLSEEYAKAAELKKLEREESPLSSAAGTVAGALAPVGVLSKGVQLLGKGAKAIAPASTIGKLGVGAGEAAAIGALGGATNYGEQKIQAATGTRDEKDVAPLSEQLKFGVAAGVAGKTIGTALEKSAQKLIDFGKSKAAKSVGFMVKDIPKRKSIGYDKARQKFLDIGETTIKAGLVKPGGSVEDVAEKSQKFVESYGKQIGEFYKKASEDLKNVKPELAEALKFNTKNLADDLHFSSLEKMDKQQLPAEVQNKIERELLPWLNKLRSMDQKTSLEDLNALRKSIDNKIKWSARELPEAQEYLANVRFGITNEVDKKLNALSDLVGGDKSKELKELNKMYSEMIQISDVSKSRALREEMALRSFSPSDYFMTGTGGLIGGIGGAVSGQDLESTIKLGLIGAGAGLANKGFKRYGNAIMGPGAYSFGQNVKPIAEAVPLGMIKGAGFLRSDKKNERK